MRGLRTDSCHTRDEKLQLETCSKKEGRWDSRNQNGLGKIFGSTSFVLYGLGKQPYFSVPHFPDSCNGLMVVTNSLEVVSGNIK